MAVTTTFKVQFGYYANGTDLTLTDFTNRTQGLSTETRAAIGQLGTRTALVTFDNNDGAMTPGNGGTYSAWDFFKRGLFVSADVSNGVATSNAKLFSGVVTDFEVNDDGRNSTVTVTAVDAFQIIGRSTPKTDYAALASSPTAGAIQAVLADNVTAIPKIGQSVPSWTVSAKTTSANDTRHKWDTGEIIGAAGDVLNNNLLTAGMLTALPDASDNGRWTLGVGVLNWGELKLTFAESGTTDLPFATIARGFNTPELTNNANLTTVDTGYNVAKSNATSADKYGARARTYTVTADGATYADHGADSWANRFADSTFDVRQLDTSTAHVESHLADGSYLDWKNALERPAWYLFDVTFTPTGGSSTTETLVSAGCRISATPNNAQVTFTFLPASSYGWFTLNNDDLGILDQNRLG
tara:strand:+ start:2961 stop:4196 length:1236 start_codon:yes stop_codon:yes gene_type:complete